MLKAFAGHLKDGLQPAHRTKNRAASRCSRADRARFRNRTGRFVRIGLSDNAGRRSPSDERWSLNSACTRRAPSPNSSAIPSDFRALQLNTDVRPPFGSSHFRSPATRPCETGGGSGPAGRAGDRLEQQSLDPTKKRTFSQETRQMSRGTRRPGGRSFQLCRRTRSSVR